MNHYYFVATLPMLTLDETPDISLETFRSDCARHLPASVAAVATALSGEHGDIVEGGGTFVARWHDAENQVRNAVARARATRRGMDISRDLRPVGAFDVAMEKAVQEAFTRATPLEREHAIDTCRWTKVDELAGHDAFSTASVFAYAVKLAIAHRWAALDERTGAAAAHVLVDQNIEQEEVPV